LIDSSESERTPRQEVVSTVFVRSRGSNFDRQEGSGMVRRRRRGKLFLRLAILIAAIAAGWYILRG
jgi:hypothetical protein